MNDNGEKEEILIPWSIWKVTRDEFKLKCTPTSCNDDTYGYLMLSTYFSNSDIWIATSVNKFFLGLGNILRVTQFRWLLRQECICSLIDWKVVETQEAFASFFFPRYPAHSLCQLHLCDAMLVRILHALYVFSIIRQVMGRTCLPSPVLWSLWSFFYSRSFFSPSFLYPFGSPYSPPCQVTNEKQAHLMSGIILRLPMNSHEHMRITQDGHTLWQMTKKL